MVHMYDMCHTGADVYICACIHTYTHTYVIVYIYIYMYIYITYIHIDMRRSTGVHMFAHACLH